MTDSNTTVEQHQQALRLQCERIRQQAMKLWESTLPLHSMAGKGSLAMAQHRLQILDEMHQCMEAMNDTTTDLGTMFEPRL